MPLTEEQKAMIECNRLKAVAKRAQITQGQESVVPNKKPFVESPSNVKTLEHNATNFYGKSSSPLVHKSKLTGKSVLLSPSRFSVEIKFSDVVINIFKSMRTSQYQAQDRLWSFALSDHDELMKKLDPLRPDITVEALPKWIVNVFFKDKSQSSTRNTSSQEDIRSRIEPCLYEALMPFQKLGIEFGIERKGRVLIADDMGLGKTIQALGIASFYREQWPLLIVCPSSMRFSWRDSLIRWIPSNSEEQIIVVTSGKNCIEGYKVVIISYDLVSKKEKELKTKNFQVSILDECHFLKNHKSNRFQSTDKVLKNTERIIMLSGTPALSRPIELYSQISILLPKLFSYPTFFGMRYCDGRKINLGNRGSHFDFSGSSNMNELRLLLEETCMIRRLKSQVLSQLPSKQREMIILDPSLVKTKDKNMSEKAKKMEQKSLTTGERRGVLLEWFNLTGISKAKAVIEYLKDLLECDKKFLCFAHHQTMMNQIGDLLDKQKVRFIRIDGNTSSEARNQHCDQFQSDEKTRVALLSITAANTGLTLTSAHLVVFAELFWNPGILTQAEDRAHRIGQTDSVMVKYLVAKGTADDELWPLLQKKLDVLNKAGLSKDNFLDSDSTYHTKKESEDNQGEEGKNKITDYFSKSLIEDLNLDDWDKDDFGMD